jgi:hypothetical protein
MQYKTIVHELLQEPPRRRAGEEMLLDLERYSKMLRDSHQAWIATLNEKRPGSNSELIASEALELAIADLQDCLANDSAAADPGPLSLDDAMSFIRNTKPNP